MTCQISGNYLSEFKVGQIKEGNDRRKHSLIFTLPFGHGMNSGPLSPLNRSLFAVQWVQQQLSNCTRTILEQIEKNPPMSSHWHFSSPPLQSNPLFFIKLGQFAFSISVCLYALFKRKNPTKSQIKTELKNVCKRRKQLNVANEGTNEWVSYLFIFISKSQKQTK